MIPLSDDERTRYLWHFLIMAAVRKVVVIPNILSLTFNSTTKHLEEISSVCMKNDLPNLAGLVADQMIEYPDFSRVELSKLTNSIPKFSAITDDETPKFNFLVAKYCCS